jgi:hypothetical protein
MVLLNAMYDDIMDWMPSRYETLLSSAEESTSTNSLHVEDYSMPGASRPTMLISNV